MKYLSDGELLKTTKNKAREIRSQTLELIELLTEIDKRKLFCELSYSSLFKYIVDELKFSESQAAIYNNIIKAKIFKQTKDLIRSGELSLFAAGAAAQEIRDQKITSPTKVKEVIDKFKGKTRGDIKAKKSEGLKLTQDLQIKIEKLKKKLSLPADMDVTEILHLLIDRELTEDKVVKTNKTITAKTRRIIKAKANYQCEFVSENGKRCTVTKHTEVDHRIPKALNGSNEGSNLRLLCRNHNQRAAIQIFGQQKMSNYLTSL